MQKYNLSQVSRIIVIAKIGRNKIYKILRELDIVDHTNRPFQKYIDQGDLDDGRPKFLIHTTLAVGLDGVDFIRQVVLDYLKDHPIPKIERKPKQDGTIDI